MEMHQSCRSSTYHLLSARPTLWCLFHELGLFPILSCARKVNLCDLKCTLSEQTPKMFTSMTSKSAVHEYFGWLVSPWYYCISRLRLRSDLIFSPILGQVTLAKYLISTRHYNCIRRASWTWEPRTYLHSFIACTSHSGCNPNEADKWDLHLSSRRKRSHWNSSSFLVGSRNKLIALWDQEFNLVGPLVRKVYTY